MAIGLRRGIAMQAWLLRGRHLWCLAAVGASLLAMGFSCRHTLNHRYARRCFCRSYARMAIGLRRLICCLWPAVLLHSLLPSPICFASLVMYNVSSHGCLT